MRTAQQLYTRLLAAAPSNDELSASRFLAEHQLHDAFAFELVPPRADGPPLRVAACTACSMAVGYLVAR